MSSQLEFRLGLERLLKRLGVASDSVVLVHEAESISKLRSRHYLTALQDIVNEGTVSILGDCRLNTSVSSKEGLSTQERLVLSSGPMLQLMTLQENCFYVSHPSLMIASVGKYARYLARHRNLDFPYGKDSVFNDFYGMNTVVLFIGDVHDLVEAKYAFSQSADALIRKDMSNSGSDVVGYLDIDVDVAKISSKIFNSNLLISEVFADHTLYGVDFKSYMEFIRARF